MRYELHVETTNPDFPKRLADILTTPDGRVNSFILCNDDGREHKDLEASLFQVDETGESGDALFTLTAEFALDPGAFPPTYKLDYIAAYPAIAKMTRDELWESTLEEREEAFRRILAAKNLRGSHELYLQRRAEAEGRADEN